MKKLIFGCLITMMCGTGFAFAPGYNCPPACDPCCESSWEGFYIGGNLGVLTHTAHRGDLDGFLTDNSGWTTNDTDFTAGVQLGYDWQWCNTLVGVVADWNWANNDVTLHDDPNGDVARTGSIRNEFDWYSTIRARAGLALNDVVFYLTAGAAVAKIEGRWTDTDNAPALTSANFDRTRWGWTGGVGTEFMLGCNFSIGAEVLFLQFSNRVHTFDFGGTAGAESFAHSDSAWVGRVMLNYRLGDLFSCCR